MERLRGLPGVCDRGVGPALVEASRVVHTFKNKRNMVKDNKEREREVIKRKDDRDTYMER